MTGLLSCSKETENIPFDYDRNFDYLSILKVSPEYTNESTDQLPEFTYQDSSYNSFVELKNTYNLDSVMGNGDELLKIFNLLNWAHNIISHDGSNSVSGPENSLNILRYCHESGNGVNCIMMAVVLNEAFLAMGFKSRLIHGNSIKFIFNGDWHAFNSVYSNTSGKQL